MKKNDLKANVNENINNIKDEKNIQKSLNKNKVEIKKEAIKIEVEKVNTEEVKNNKVIEEVTTIYKIEIEKVDLEEVIEEIIIEENIFESINNKIVDFIENKCLIIKGLNLISDLTNKCHNEKTNTTRVESSLSMKETYEESGKRISESKRREEVIKILDTKYKNKMDKIEREHTIKLYVNDSTRFMVTL